jgi:hypothetical protein|tara:strand:- start:565 stop:798 length:234 start_codon:yes stop_codon:yes gene_type:complete
VWLIVSSRILAALEFALEIDTQPVGLGQANGRGVAPKRLIAADYATVDLVMDKTQSGDFRLKDIVIQVANSDLMTSR